MISFDILTSDNFRAVAGRISEKCPTGDADYILDVAEQLATNDDGCEYAVSLSSGCLLIRVFDERYFFLYPEPVCEDYNICEALNKMRLYAVREEIGLTLCEVPRDELQKTRELFAHTDYSEEDYDGELFTVEVLNELDLAESLPTLSGERVSITPLDLSDSEKYALLCRDTETNRFWGYNYADDEPECEDSYFFENAMTELSRSVAVSFAIRLGCEFIGEALLYAFDFLGGAECAIRLLPEYRGKGLSSECITLLCDAAKVLDLRRAYATVSIENHASMHLFQKSFTVIESNDQTARFIREL